jgi:hypothetical protein
MNSREKIKPSKTKSKTSRELDDELSKAIARAEAAAEVNAAKAIANAPAANARIDQEIEKHRRENEEAVRIGEARRARVTEARELLVKALGMLGSDQVVERAAAALTAERLRVELHKTWNELIVREHDDDDDLDDDEDIDDEDDDLDEDEDEET